MTKEIQATTAKCPHGIAPELCSACVPQKATTPSVSPENSGCCPVPAMRPGADEIQYRLASLDWLMMHRPDREYGCTCKWPGIFFGDPTPAELDEIEAELGHVDYVKRLVTALRQAWAEETKLRKLVADQLHRESTFEQYGLGYEAGRAAEREECAKLAESYMKAHHEHLRATGFPVHAEREVTCLLLVEAIRARTK
jgi:hypothetical protein